MLRPAEFKEIMGASTGCVRADFRAFTVAGRDPVIPAQAGIQEPREAVQPKEWIPACAGMTEQGDFEGWGLCFARGRWV